jgi:hypothetical protein
VRVRNNLVGVKQIMTPAIFQSMAWANERFGLSCFDNSGLKKALLKMVVLDNSNNSNSKQKVSYSN